MSDEFNCSVRRKGYKLTIFHDTIEDPRIYNKDDNIGNLVCFHERLELGDGCDFKNMKEFEKWVIDNKEKIAGIMPVYLYDDEYCNGCVSLALEKEIGERKAVGKIGYIYTTKEELKNAGFMYQNYTQEDLESDYYAEIMEYDDWLQDSPPYYSFEIEDENKNLICSMGVFEGNGLKDMLDEMKDRSEHNFDFLFDAALKKLNENYL